MLRSENARGLGIITLSAVLATVAAMSAQDDKAQIQKMHDNLEQVATLDYAVIRGDLEDASAAAKALAGMSATGLPATYEQYIKEIRTAATAAAGATELSAAAAAAGTLQAACGNCHAATGHTVKLAADAKVEGAISTRTRMREHAWSVDALAKGLQGPSDELWKKGAKSMKDSRTMKVEMKDAQLATELNEVGETFKSLAGKAQQAKDTTAKAAVYGEILTTCGHCHSLQGRVFGPPMPK